MATWMQIGLGLWHWLRRGLSALAQNIAPRLVPASKDAHIYVDAPSSKRELDPAFYITNGRAYLTGPYEGAPIVVPAVAGPFDLGTVVVRSAMFVDNRTANVRVVSDPLPTILQGIPLDVREIQVNANKPDFFLNPTSCAEKTIAAGQANLRFVRVTLPRTINARFNVIDASRRTEDLRRPSTCTSSRTGIRSRTCSWRCAARSTST